VNISWVVTDEASRDKALDLLKEADSIAKTYSDSEKKLVILPIFLQWQKELMSDLKVEFNETNKQLFSMECKLVYAESLLQRAFVQLSLGSYLKGIFIFALPTIPRSIQFPEGV
jgi:hypothetical protein